MYQVLGKGKRSLIGTIVPNTWYLALGTQKTGLFEGTLYKYLVPGTQKTSLIETIVFKYLNSI